MMVKAMTSHYRRHPLQLLALAFMIVVATMLWTGVSVLTGQARDSLDVSEEAVAAREAVVRSDGQPVSVVDFVALRTAGICAAPWLETTRGDPKVRVIGIDPLAMACFDAPPAGDGVGELAGDPFVDMSEVAGQPGQLSLLISPGTGALPNGYQRKEFRLGPATGQLADSFLLNLDALSLLVLFITGLLVRSVYHLGLAQRRSSFALLERFGVGKRQVYRLLTAELIILTLVCVLPGVWLGQALANRLGQGFGLALDSLFDLSLYGSADTPVPSSRGRDDGAGAGRMFAGSTDTAAPGFPGQASRARNFSGLGLGDHGRDRIGNGDAGTLIDLGVHRRGTGVCWRWRFGARFSRPLRRCDGPASDPECQCSSWALALSGTGGHVS